MYKAKVLRGFRDKQTNQYYNVGDIYKIYTHDRAMDLIHHKLKLIEIIDGEKELSCKRKGPKIIIYQNYLYHIGGIETFLYNFTKHYKDRNITIVVDHSEIEPLLTLSKYADIHVKQPGEKFECDVLILGNYNGDGLHYIKAKKVYQMIHADWDGLCQIPAWANFYWTKPSAVDNIICVSDTAAKGLKKRMGYDSEVIYNILDDNINDDEAMFFITLSRATKEKGIFRIIEMAQRFKAAGKKFKWFLCCTLEQESAQVRNTIAAIPEFIILPPDVANKSFIRHCDYLVQLSDTESFCYSAFEALQRGVPVILTDFPEAFNIVKEGENGFIVKRDLSNLDIDKIFNHKPSNITYEDRCDYDKWEKVFNGEL